MSLVTCGKVEKKKSGNLSYCKILLYTNKDSLVRCIIAELYAYSTKSI